MSKKFSNGTPDISPNNYKRGEPHTILSHLRYASSTIYEYDIEHIKLLRFFYLKKYSFTR